MKLKRARLTDDLNEKIAQRPGPMELVEKNILPVDSGVKEVVNGSYSLIPPYHLTVMRPGAAVITNPFHGLF